MIALLVITDGRRDCILNTVPSALANLRGAIGWRFIFDDSGDPDHREWLAMRFLPLGFSIMWEDERQGFGGAIRAVWSRLTQFDHIDHVFHLEDDFTFNRPVNLDAMAATLDAHPEIQQLALRRQAWNQAEIAAGGVVEVDPDSYVERAGGYGQWLEHRNFITTNPSLYRRSLMDRGWPEGDNSEGRFALDLFASDPLAVAGYWGARNSGEAVHHIGRERVGNGY